MILVCTGSDLNIKIKPKVFGFAFLVLTFSYTTLIKPVLCIITTIDIVHLKPSDTLNNSLKRQYRPRTHEPHLLSCIIKTMPPRTGQKRAAASNAEPSSSRSNNHAPKKTRFVEPSDDPLRFAEEVDSALETPSTNRKGRVRNEGYDSDSSDDGEGVVLSRKKDGAEEDDENDDMFAVAEKEDKQEETRSKKKKEYLRLGDIEGQEFNSGSDSDSDDDEPEDEDDAERRKKAGMGFELSSFNMRDEMEEGKFTEDGSYVRTFDPHGVHDRWMEGLADKEIKMARRRKRHQERQQRERIAAEERELKESGGG